MTGHTSAEALLPCPFCGGRAELHKTRGGEDSMLAWVNCVKCGSQTDEFEDAYAPTAQAISGWNQRAALSLPQAQGVTITDEMRDRARDLTGKIADEVASCCSDDLARDYTGRGSLLFEANEVICALLASLPKDSAQGGVWQPIETAPKDGSWVVAWDEKHNWRDRPPIVSVRWEVNAFADRQGFTYGNISYWIAHVAPTDRGDA